jgi:hypothetical protein
MLRCQVAFLWVGDAVYFHLNEFFSAYSPELNRIETMWQLMKHRWLDNLLNGAHELSGVIAA